MTGPSSGFDAAILDWTKGGGLIPAVVQDARSLRVLMLGYMNEESLQTTRETGLVTFYSRSKKRLWQKGEISGHVLKLRSLRADCDLDALLILADPVGPTCHLGSQSCFGSDDANTIAFLVDLAAVIRDRRHNPQTGSYTAKLFAEGITRIALKVGEEGVEVALAATDKSRLTDEAADLIYHLLILLEAGGSDLLDVVGVLAERAKPSSNSKTR